jgi:GNAT superfamily N-acetyltransferase
MGPRLIDVTDAQGRLVAPDWLARAEKVHRQLRTALAADYRGTLERMFAGGARMLVAVEPGTELVVGVAIFRVFETTFDGVRLYVDDLVTDEVRRSRGVGKALLDGLEARARERGCQTLALDSGVQRARAHRFYFREGMIVSSFAFKKGLGPHTVG